MSKSGGCNRVISCYVNCSHWTALLWTVLNNAIQIWNLLLYYINMWAAFLMRILRKRIVLVIIFALSLTYCILSFLREVRIYVHNDTSHNNPNIRKFIHVTILRLFSICKMPCCRLYRILIKRLCSDSQHLDRQNKQYCYQIFYITVPLCPPNQSCTLTDINLIKLALYHCSV
jgi:hypothetical protein